MDEVESGIETRPPIQLKPLWKSRMKFVETPVDSALEASVQFLLKQANGKNLLIFFFYILKKINFS